MSEKNHVKIGGIRQNCYRRDVDLAYKPPQKRDDTVRYYESLERKNLSNGYIEQVEVKDYPINAASITSYADGADYRRDPMAAVSNAPKRVNLGDITQVQDFLKNDPQQAVRIYRDVLSKLVDMDKDLPGKDSQIPQPSTPEQGGKNE